MVKAIISYLDIAAKGVARIILFAAAFIITLILSFQSGRKKGAADTERDQIIKGVKDVKKANEVAKDVRAASTDNLNERANKWVRRK